MHRILPMGMFILLTVQGGYPQLPPAAVHPRRLSASIREVVGVTVPIRWESWPLQKEHRERLRERLRVRRIPFDTLTIGHLVQDSLHLDILLGIAPSKAELFIFAVYLDPDRGSVFEVDVLDYRESYGGEIDYIVFRRQFRGKQSPEDIIFRKTIRNISGATISARSLTRGVRRLLMLYRFMSTRYDLHPLRKFNNGNRQPK